MTTAMKPRMLADGLIFPEGLRWHDGTFFFSDMDSLELTRPELDGSRQDAPRLHGPGV